MANSKSDIEVKKFSDHHVITQPNPLRKVLRRVADDDIDDPVARAEKALSGLSGEFRQWMEIEVGRLAAAHAAILKSGFTKTAREINRPWQRVITRVSSATDAVLHGHCGCMKITSVN